MPTGRAGLQRPCRSSKRLKKVELYFLNQPQSGTRMKPRAQALGGERNTNQLLGSERIIATQSPWTASRRRYRAFESPPKPSLRLELPLRRRCTQRFLWFFSLRRPFGSVRDLLVQRVQQRIQNDFERLRILRQHPFDAFAMYGQLTERPRPSDVNPAARSGRPVPASHPERCPGEGIVKAARCHPMNHQFLNMIDAARDLNALVVRPFARSIAESSACLPSDSPRPENGSGKRISLRRKSHTTLLCSSFIRHPSVPAERQTPSSPVVSISDAGQARGYSRDGSEP